MKTLMKTLITISILSLCIMCSNSPAKNRSCAINEAIEAETSISTLKDWAAIYDSFKKFRHCDDGSIAEGYSNAIVHTLADQWDEMETLVRFALTDVDFYKFILKHIDASTDKSELEMVLTNSGKHCIKLNGTICDAINKRAKSALEYIQSVEKH